MSGLNRKQLDQRSRGRPLPGAIRDHAAAGFGAEPTQQAEMEMFVHTSLMVVVSGGAGTPFDAYLPFQRSTLDGNNLGISSCYDAIHGAGGMPAALNGVKPSALQSLEENMRSIFATILGLATVFTVPPVQSLAGSAASPPAKQVCHQVAKKVHGKQKTVQVCKRVKAKKVILGATTFYSATDNPPSGSCTAPGQQAGSSFLSTAPIIEADTIIKKWKGTHKLTWNWINASGSVASTATGTFHDLPKGRIVCDWLYVGGRDSTTASGTWHLQLVFGRRIGRTTSYTMTRTADSVVRLGGTPIMYRIPAGVAAASNSCQTAGVTASAAASITDQYVLVYVPINVWQGTHAIQFQWNGPSGYSESSPTTSYADLGFQRYWCDSMPVAGAQEAGYPGSWTVTVYVDSIPVVTQNFTLSS